MVDAADSAKDCGYDSAAAVRSLSGTADLALVIPYSDKPGATGATMADSDRLAE